MDGCPATMKKWDKKAFLTSDMANLTYNAYFIPYGEGGEETVTTTLGDFAVSVLCYCCCCSCDNFCVLESRYASAVNGLHWQFNFVAFVVAVGSVGSPPCLARIRPLG